MPTLHFQTTVQPGGKVVIVSPDLPVGEMVEMTITVVEPTADTGEIGVDDRSQTQPPSSESAGGQ